MKTVLTKESMLNPYFFQGKMVESIIVYAEQGVVFSFKWIGSNNITSDVTFDFEIKRAVKENYSRKDAYYLPYKDNFGTKNRVVLYIHESLIKHKYNGRVKRFENKMGHSLYNEYTITLNCKKWELLKVNNDWEYAYSEQKDHDFVIETFVESVKSKYGEECERISELCSKVGRNLSPYDIDKLRDVLIIKEK